MLCVLDWAGPNCCMVGRPFHGFAMLQSLGFLGIGWLTDVVWFDDNYAAPPPKPAADSPDYKAWIDTYDEPQEPFVVRLPFGTLAYQEGDSVRALAQFAFAFMYELAFRIVFQYVCVPLPNQHTTF